MTPTGRYGLLTLVILALCALVFAPAVSADSHVRIVRLSYVDGPVQIDRNTGQGFEKAILNMPVVEGSKLWTEDGGKAEVEFEDGSTIRLGPNTRLDFTELTLRSDGGKANAVTVEKGIAYFDVAHRGKDEFRVTFAGDTIALDRAARFRLTLDDYGVEVADIKGDLKITGAQEASLKKGHTLTINPGDEKAEIAKGVQQDPLDQWVKGREEYRDRYASNASYGAPYRGYYGLADLSYYGNYYDLPGYGWAWRPFGAAFGWSPFMDGAWCWYPGAGYTWVSAYPWGWIPYRYGSWFWDPYMGWMWSPFAGGSWYWNQRNWTPGSWVTVPPVTKAPPTFRPPQPPVTAIATGGKSVPLPVTNGVLARRTDTDLRHPTVWVRGGAARQPGETGLTTRTPAAISVPSMRTQPGMFPATGRGDLAGRSGSPGMRPSHGANSMNRGMSPSSAGPRSAPAPRMEGQRQSAPAPRMESPRPSAPPPSMSAPRMGSPSMSAPRSAPSGRPPK